MRKLIPAFIGLFFIFICSCTKKETPAPVSTPFFDSVISYANQVQDSGYKAEAFEMVTSAHANTGNLTAEDDMNYYTWCGEYYRKDLKNYDKYIAYADSIMLALEQSRQVTNLPQRSIQAYEMKADALFAKGMYNESYDYYYKAQKMAKDTHDSCSLSQFSYSLGMVLYRQQRFMDAAGYFTEALNDINHCKDEFVFFYRRQELLDNIGLCYYHARQYDSAMLFYNKTLACIDGNHHRFGKNESVYASARAVVYGNMADLYIIFKDYDTAKTLLKKSISINLQKGYTNSDAIIDQVKLTSLYFNTGDMPGMKALLQDIKAELDTIPDRQVEQSLNKLMWQYYDHEKDSATAYHYLKAYVLMNDSSAAFNKTLMASDVDGVIKGLEKQYQINLLNKNSLQSRIYLAIASLIALMGLVIILLILINAKRSRENIKDLKRLNDQVNEQKEQLQIALTELEWKDKDKSRILRSAAHDVLSPIAAISGLVDIIISESENFSEEHKEILKLVKESCNNSISLSKDILEAATASDKNPLPKEWVNLNKLLASSVDLFSLRAAAKKQQIRFTANHENAEAFVNKEKIWRVVNNLISNAIKFSYENSTIELRLELKSGKADISVKDCGIGIPEKNKPFIFDMFTEAKTAGTSGEAPHGLGLSISLQIAKAHYGIIWFESEEGKGTTFHFVIPVNSGA